MGAMMVIGAVAVITVKGTVLAAAAWHAAHEPSIPVSPDAGDSPVRRGQSRIHAGKIGQSQLGWRARLSAENGTATRRYDETAASSLEGSTPPRLHLCDSCRLRRYDSPPRRAGPRTPAWPPWPPARLAPPASRDECGHPQRGLACASSCT